MVMFMGELVSLREGNGGGVGIGGVGAPLDSQWRCDSSTLRPIIMVQCKNEMGPSNSSYTLQIVCHFPLNHEYGRKRI